MSSFSPGDQSPRIPCFGGYCLICPSGRTCERREGEDKDPGAPCQRDEDVTGSRAAEDQRSFRIDYACSREGRGMSSAMTAPAARNAAPTGSAAVSPAANDDGAA